jgi:hypothetical protein
MADNVVLNPSYGGETVASDEIGGFHHQRVKMEFGGDGTATEVKTPTPLPVAQATSGEVKTIFVRYVDTIGDGSGDKQAIGDYSGTSETVFKFAPGAGQVARVHRLMLQVEDVGTFDSAKYGNGITLANGISIATHDSTSELIDLTDGLPIKTNADWGRICYDVSVLTFGQGNEHLIARWTFSKAGAPLRLDGDLGQYLGITLSDDFSGLVAHTFCLQGYWE